MGHSLLSHRLSYLTSSTSSSSSTSWLSSPRVDLSSEDLPSTLSRLRLSFALPVPLFVSLCSTFIYPSTCLLRRCTPSLPPPTPVIGRRAYTRTIFPIPTRLRSLLAPPLPSARAFFIYSVNSRTTRLLDHDERSVLRFSVKILFHYAHVCRVFYWTNSRSTLHFSFDRCFANTGTITNLHIIIALLITTLITMTMRQFLHFGWTLIVLCWFIARNSWFH